VTACARTIILTYLRPEAAEEELRIPAPGKRAAGG
jgi:hypothetical protein